MDEASARAFVPRETIPRIEAFLSLLREENERQNLVSRASLDSVWTRHVADSAQLVRFAPPQASSWLDLGAGAGFPGLIAALLHRARITLVESRKLRADFLRRAAAVLEVESKVEIVCGRVEAMAPHAFDVIGARAFAPLDRLLALGRPFSTTGTIWILPKGRNAQTELEAARSSWQGAFRVEPSLTDPEAGIVIASAVRAVRKENRNR
jgi:16S rRNA (guanine527-N7)-methyltransferase